MEVSIVRVIWIILYPISAICATLAKQLMTLVGIRDQKTLIISQITSLGVILSGINPFLGVNSATTITNKKSSILLIFGYALLNLSGGYFCNWGILLCGSGIFQVVHSSVVMNSAIISFVVRKHKMNLLQTVGIVIIFSGLASTAIPYLSESGMHVVAGAIFSFLGTFLFSVSYVVDEYLMEHFDHFQISSKELSLKSGIISFILLTGYQQLFLQSELLKEVSMWQSWKWMIVVMMLQLFSDVFNNLAYYQAIFNMGAVSTGVMQGLVSVGVFFTSHYLFCQYQSFQCLNAIKVFATGIVVVGVVMYSFGKQKQVSSEREHTISLPKVSLIDENTYDEVETPRYSLESLV